MTQDKAYPLKKPLVIDGSLLFVYLAITIYLFYMLATARPYVGSWLQLLIIVTMFGVVRRAVFLIYTLRTKKILGHKFVISVGLFVVGLLIASVVSRIASGIAVDRMTLAYQPLINALHSDEVEPCEAGNTEINVADAIRPKIYNTRAGNSSTIHFADEYFIVSISGGSIDIDGSTLYYESQSKHWSQFHNDVYNDRSTFEGLTKNTLECKLTED